MTIKEEIYSMPDSLRAMTKVCIAGLQQQKELWMN